MRGWALLLVVCACGGPPEGGPSEVEEAEEAACTNGVVDGDEACDGEPGCAADCRVQGEWVVEFGERYAHVAVLPDDNLLLSGEFSDATGDAVTARLRSDGSEAWQHKHSFPGTFAADYLVGSGLLRGATNEGNKPVLHAIDDEAGSVVESWSFAAGVTSAPHVAWSPLGMGYALVTSTQSAGEALFEVVRGEGPVEVPLPVASIRAMSSDGLGNLWLVSDDGTVTVINRRGEVRFEVDPPGDAAFVAHDDDAAQGCMLWLERGEEIRYAAAWIRRIDRDTGSGPDIEIRRGELDLAAVGVAVDGDRCAVQLLVQDPVSYTAWFETMLVGAEPLRTWSTEPSDFQIFSTGSIAFMSTGAVVTTEYFFDRDTQRNASRVRTRVP